jgi:hypothetical protein
MEFFNKKEEVLDIQITPLGKRLLQLGQFKPVAYAFFDNDIVYDGKFAGLLEKQNDIKERIKEVPRIKQQTFLYSPEEKIQSNTEESDLMSYNENLFRDKTLTGYQTLSQEYNLQKQEAKQIEFESYGPLGNMAYQASSSPAWNLQFFDAELTGSVSVLTGSNNQKITNLECDIQYKFKFNTVEPGTIEDPADEALLQELEDELFITTTPISNDGSYLKVMPEAFFIKTLENNTNFQNENFDIELYHIDSQGTEQQLYFVDEGSDFNNTPLSVGYWFDVLVDAEIPDAVYCEQVKSEKLEVTYTDKFLFDCEDLIDENLAVDQIYNIPGGDTEPCE